MALGSNNPFPSVLVVDGTTPATPASGRTRIFVRSSDGHVCRVDDAGSVVDLEGATASGSVVQTVNTQTGAVATGTTTLPADDTIPQNTEGDEYMTLAITPTSATNKLRIDVVAMLSCNTNSRTIAAALFQDSTANALAMMPHTIANNGSLGMLAIKFSHYMTAGTTSSTTFKVRAGVETSGTVTFNGSNGARFYGGVVASSITITEMIP